MEFGRLRDVSSSRKLSRRVKVERIVRVAATGVRWKTGWGIHLQHVFLEVRIEKIWLQHGGWHLVSKVHVAEMVCEHKITCCEITTRVDPNEIAVKIRGELITVAEHARGSETADWHRTGYFGCICKSRREVVNITGSRRDRFAVKKLLKSENGQHGG